MVYHPIPGARRPYVPVCAQARRWALICVLCKQKVGACIQCSVKSCKTAYHVTCAFKHNLKMKPVEDESDDDEIKLKVSRCAG